MDAPLCDTEWATMKSGSARSQNAISRWTPTSNPVIRPTECWNSPEFQNNSDSHPLIPLRLPEGRPLQPLLLSSYFLFGRFKETLHRTGNGSVFGMDSDLRKKALASRVPLSRPSPENRPFFPPISEDPIPPLTSLTDILVFSGGAIPVKWPNFSHH